MLNTHIHIARIFFTILFFKIIPHLFVFLTFLSSQTHNILLGSGFTTSVRNQNIPRRQQLKQGQVQTLRQEIISLGREAYIAKVPSLQKRSVICSLWFQTEEPGQMTQSYRSEFRLSYHQIWQHMKQVTSLDVSQGMTYRLSSLLPFGHLYLGLPR